jgi:hypothetical protein
VLIISGQKGGQATGGSYLDLLGFYSSQNIMRQMESRNAMDWACSMHRSQKKCMKVFVVGKLEGENHLEDSGADGKLILKLVLKIEFEGLDWKYLNQDRDRWRAVVNWSVQLDSIKYVQFIFRETPSKTHISLNSKFM